jgi:hypothetical protein
MAMIFPGMDPYLENPHAWPGVHSRLIVYLADQLQPRLRPRYIAAVEQRVYLEGADRQFTPDVSVRKHHPATRLVPAALPEGDAPEVLLFEDLEVHEAFLEIRDRNSGMKVVTIIEVVSPANKYAGPGRDSYVAKQREVFDSPANLVEIDLLRYGPHVLAVPEYGTRMRFTYDYLTSVSRAAAGRRRFEVYPRRLDQRLPRIRVPLAADDGDTVLDVQAVVERAYEQGAYRDWIDYSAPCDPPLTPGQQEWATRLIASAPLPPPADPSSNGS